MIPNKILTRDFEITITIVCVMLVSLIINLITPDYYWLIKLFTTVGYVSSFIYLTTLKGYRFYLFIAAIGFYALANVVELQEKNFRSDNAHIFYVIGHVLMVCSVIRYAVYNQFNR